MELIKLMKCLKDAQATWFFCLEKQTPIWPVTTKGNLVKVLVIPRIIPRAAIQRRGPMHTVMDRNFVYLYGADTIAIYLSLSALIS
jgi:hypothetical protein